MDRRHANIHRRDIQWSLRSQLQMLSMLLSDRRRLILESPSAFSMAKNPYWYSPARGLRFAPSQPLRGPHSQPDGQTVAFRRPVADKNYGYGAGVDAAVDVGSQ